MEEKYRILIEDPLKTNKITVANVDEMFQRALVQTAENARALMADPHKYEKLHYWCSLRTMNLLCAFLDTQPFINRTVCSEGITYRGYLVRVAEMDDDVVLFGTK